MKIDLSGKNLELTPSIKVYIDEKLGGLEKYIGKFNEEGAVELRVSIARTTAHHHKGEVYATSADLHLPGRTLHAEASDSDVRISVDSVRHKLLSEIETYKGKQGQ